MAFEELLDNRHDLLPGILEHQVTGIGETMHLGLRQRLLPYLQEVLVKNKVFIAPQDQGGARPLPV